MPCVHQGGSCSQLVSFSYAEAANFQDLPYDPTAVLAAPRDPAFCKLSLLGGGGGCLWLQLEFLSSCLLASMCGGSFSVALMIPALFLKAGKESQPMTKSSSLVASQMMWDSVIAFNSH